jgi:hypothetical protein
MGSQRALCCLAKCTLRLCVTCVDNWDLYKALSLQTTFFVVEPGAPGCVPGVTFTQMFFWRAGHPDAVAR